jgi:hypothetical protein
VKLVQSHSGVSQSVASGIHAVPGVSSSLAATQAAYRFFHNERVTLTGLAAPLLKFTQQEAPLLCDHYLLVVHDWSSLSVQGHTRKRDRVTFSRKQVSEGYEMQSALAVSDRDGLPIAPLVVSLRSSEGVHCSRCWDVREPLSKLDELDPTMQFLECQEFGRPMVHIIDAEADSVDHYRQWSEQPGRFYLVRGDDRVVEYDGQEQKCSVIQQKLREEGRFQLTRDVQHHGQRAQQFVAEVSVRLLRAGQRNRPEANDRRRMRGNPLPLRLILSEVRSPDGKLLATWYLLTNVPPEVDSSTVALWYYWRWNIENFFKLLKSAGIQVEHWQQTSAAAIARRMLVACMACVVVWRLARSTEPQASTARRLLVQLSGRQMKRGVEFTPTALLAGMWVLLSILHALETYSLQQLNDFAHAAFGHPP